MVHSLTIKITQTMAEPGWNILKIPILIWNGGGGVILANLSLCISHSVFHRRNHRVHKVHANSQFLFWCTPHSLQGGLLCAMATRLICGNGAERLHYIDHPWQGKPELQLSRRATGLDWTADPVLIKICQTNVKLFHGPYPTDEASKSHEAQDKLWINFFF